MSVRPTMELGSTEAVREAVAAGLGVSVISRHAVRPRDPRVVALHFQDRRCVRDLLVIRRRGATPSPAAARLLELLLRSPVRGGDAR